MGKEFYLEWNFTSGFTACTADTVSPFHSLYLLERALLPTPYVLKTTFPSDSWNLWDEKLHLKEMISVLAEGILFWHIAYLANKCVSLSAWLKVLTMEINSSKMSAKDFEGQWLHIPRGLLTLIRCFWHIKEWKKNLLFLIKKINLSVM